MKEVFRGRKFRVLSGLVRLPNGQEVVRDIIDFGESVVIIPIKDDGKVVLLEQYRAAIGRWIYELPAGTLEAGEDPMECALRELREETGYEAGRISYLFSMYLSPGYSNEYMHVYLGENLNHVGAAPEEGELIKVTYKSFEECMDMIRKNIIVDAKTIAALLYYKNFRGWIRSTS